MVNGKQCSSNCKRKLIGPKAAKTTKLFLGTTGRSVVANRKLVLLSASALKGRKL